MSSGLPIAPATRELLTKKAWGDFVHDFDDPVRANVTVGVLNTVPIEVTSSIKNKYKELVEKISTASGGKTSATAFQLFRSYFGNTIPPAEVPTTVLHENDITGLVGINYAQLVSGLKADTASTLDLGTGAFLSGFRRYAVSAATEKIKGQHQHMVSCLNRLSGRTEIVIMWDAGACEISEVGSNFDASAVIPGFDVGGQYDIYFINSKENLSDPAPKPTFDTLSTKNPNVNIYFLEEWDRTETTIYPAWPRTAAAEAAADQGDQNTNLYSGYRLITKRGEGKTVSGTLFTTGGTQIEIADIKETSKVANAVTTAVLDMLMGKSAEEFMTPILLKRAGDWCQALTLLDRSRRYRIVPARGNVMRGGGYPVDTPVTLADFERNNALIALITNDRVLLAFAIALGLHVLFTNVRNGINWLLLFLNTDTGRVDDKDAVLAKALSELGAIDGEVARLIAGIQTLQGKIVTSLDGLGSTFDLASFIFIRDAMYRLTRLPSADDLTSAKGMLIATGTAIEKGDPAVPLALGLGILRSINSRLDAARDIAGKLLNPETAVYPDAATETETLRKITEVLQTGGVIPPTADLYIQYQTIIDKLAADSAKLPVRDVAADEELPPLFKLTALPDDSVVRAALLARTGREPPMSRGSRSMPALTPIGLLFRYYNTRLNLDATRGGARPFALTGGGANAVAFEQTFLIPYLRNSKEIVAYTTDTTSAAENVDAMVFIAKENNYVQNIDGTYTTVVDGFLNTTFNRDVIASLFSTPAFSTYPTPVDGMLALLGSDIDVVYPLLYVLLKGLLNSYDVLYSELLGVQSLEYSNLDALNILARVELALATITPITNTVHLNDPLLNVHIKAFLESCYTAWTMPSPGLANPDDIQKLLIDNANAADNHALLVYRYQSEYPADTEGSGFPFYREEVGPQIMYDSRVARTISKLLTDRDVLIETFSVPLLQRGGRSLADYSRELGDMPSLVAGDPALNAPRAAVEELITDSFKAQSSGAPAPAAPSSGMEQEGGFHARRSLYKKHAPTPETSRVGGRRGLYEGLRQRTRTGATARVRQLPVVSRTRRQRKHVDRV